MSGTFRAQGIAQYMFCDAQAEREGFWVAQEQVATPAEAGKRSKDCPHGLYTKNHGQCLQAYRCSGTHHKHSGPERAGDGEKGRVLHRLHVTV